MAPSVIVNGTNSGMPLTEYSSNPTSSAANKIPASSLLPEGDLLPDGQPDVRKLMPMTILSTDNFQYLKLILRSRVYDVITETPLTPALNLSNRLECKVLLKREDEQPVFSFKIRGAYNKMAHLDEEERWKGVIACSAGERSSRALSQLMTERV